MKFKNAEIAADWERWRNRKPPHEPFMRLDRVMLVIDALSQATGHGEIVLTEFLRPKGSGGYHPEAQAADFRVHGKSKEWYAAMILFKWVLFRLDSQVQLVPHLELYGTEHQHIHCEIDDNSLTKR